MDAVSLRVCITLGFLALAIVVALAFRRFLTGFLDFFYSISPRQRVFLLLFAAIFILYGGDKNDATNEPSAGPPLRLTYHPGVLNLSTGGSLGDIPGTMPQFVLSDELVVTNLMFFGFRGGTNVAFGLTWPCDDSSYSGYMNLYCNWTLEGAPWVLVDSPYVRRSDACLVGELDWASLVSDAIASGEFPTNADTQACFMAATWVGDSDEDYLEDGDEIFVYRTDPHNPDTDGDGYEDWLEVDLGTNPRNPDSDGDGLTDGWELDYYFDPLIWDDADLDSDEDGLSDRMECQHGTDPWWEDTDGDGLWDAVEIRFGLDPCSTDGDGGASGDYDHDGISNADEIGRGLNPCDPDTDGDGLVDSIDPHPLASDGDCFGPRQTLPERANTNAYCWIELVADTNVHVVFRGDGASNLPDPDFMAKAGVTNRVTLLIGKRYEVSCSQPVEIVGQSDEAVRISDVTPSAFTVVWPVEFTIGEGRAPGSPPLFGATWNDGGKAFYVSPNPSGLGGTITWTNEPCCEVQGDGVNFSYSCDNTCHCTGCTVYGNYRYEGYGLFVWGLPCGCHYVEDHGTAGVSISFARSAVIYEDAYTNGPDTVIYPARSNAVFRCTVRGGTYGGTLTVSLNGAGLQKLSKIRGNTLPNGAWIAAGSRRTFETVYEVLEPSDSEGDIRATALFHEDFLNVVHSNDTSMTSVKVELESNRVALLNSCRQRHVYGVAEDVRLKSYPALATASWNVSINGMDVLDSPLYPAGEGFICSWTAGVGRVEYTLGNESYFTSISVIEPEIEIRNVRANDRFSEEAKMWDPTLVDVDPVVGESGHLLLFLDRYAAPYYVSFEGLQFVEIPDESHNCPHDRQGYYADETRGGPLSHTQLAGAGRWRQTNSQAFFGTDAAGTHEAYSQPWMDGWKSWPIPMGWGYGVDVLGRFRDYPTFQTYTLSSDGTFQIDKFNHWAERNTLGMVWVDGSLQVSPWPW